MHTLDTGMFFPVHDLVLMLTLCDGAGLSTLKTARRRRRRRKRAVGMVARARRVVTRTSLRKNPQRE